MIGRRAVLAGLAAAPWAAAAQGAHRIDMILWRGETEVEAGFRAYLERRGIAAEIVVHDIARDRALIPGILAEIRAAGPDLVYTWGTSIALATAGAQGAADPAVNITDIPVLSTMVSYPVAAGLVAESGLSGRNNTAVSHVPPIATQIEAMRRYRPVDRIGVIYNPAEANSVVNVRDLTAEASARGIGVVALEVPQGAGGAPDPGALPGLLAALARAGVGFLYIGPDNFVGEHSVEITRGAIALGVPAFTATELEVREASALFGLVSRYEAVGALTGRQAERILVEGARPGEMPVETLGKFTFLIRRDAMIALEMYPPMEILRYAVVID